MPKRSRTEAKPEDPVAAFLDLEAVESSDEDDEGLLTELEGKSRSNLNRLTLVDDVSAHIDLTYRQIYRTPR